jgi:hypothetical protein
MLQHTRMSMEWEKRKQTDTLKRCEKRKFFNPMNFFLFSIRIYVKLVVAVVVGVRRHANEMNKLK